MPSMLEPLIFPRPDEHGGLILIEREVMHVVESYRQRDTGALEAGGILIGFRRGAHLQIVEATPPQPTDRRSRTSFRRASKGHAEIARQRWGETGGTADYVGEWHTHPEERPSPSGLDRQEWQALMQSQQRAMLFLIAGSSKTHWFGLTASVGTAVVRLANAETRVGPVAAAPDLHHCGSRRGD